MKRSLPATLQLALVNCFFLELFQFYQTPSRKVSSFDEVSVPIDVRNPTSEGLRSSFIRLNDLVKSDDELICEDNLNFIYSRILPESVTHVRPIPKIIHMTSKSPCMTAAFRDNIDKWRFTNHSFYFHDEIAVDRLLAKNWPEFPHLQLISNCLVSGAGKADLWRYLVLYEYGGIYTDIDNAPGVLFVENLIADDDDSFFVIESFGVLSQYFMAASPRHPLMYLSVLHTLHRLLEVENIGMQYVPFVTGPGALKNAFISFMEAKGTKTYHKVRPGSYTGIANRTVRAVGTRATSNYYVKRNSLPGKEKSDGYAAMGMKHFSKSGEPQRNKSCFVHLHSLNSYTYSIPESGASKTSSESSELRTLIEHASLMIEQVSPTKPSGRGSEPVFEIPLKKSFFAEPSTLNLPMWLNAYIEFHRQSLKDLNETNWESKRFLIIRCIQRDHCGGTSDRLKPIPLFLLLAAKSRRLLFIRWTHPYPLEEFMMPVNVNWTVPEWMNEVLDSRRTDFTRSFAYGGTRLESEVFLNNLTILETLMRNPDGGAQRYNQLTGDHRDDWGPDYHFIFRSILQPSPAIADILSQFFFNSGLEPGQYAVAHQRAMYGGGERGDSVSHDDIASEAINAVNCASQLLPGAPIFYASDSVVGYRAVRDYAEAHNRSIITRGESFEQMLHLDIGAIGQSEVSHLKASTYYATFVDLWIMGSGRCVAFGKGGFGSWGLLLGYNVSCGYRYVRQRNKCTWKDTMS